MANHIAPIIAPTDPVPTEEPDGAALRTLAGSVLVAFRERGYNLRHVIVLTSELVGLACDAIRSSGPPAGKR